MSGGLVDGGCATANASNGLEAALGCVGVCDTSTLRSKSTKSVATVSLIDCEASVLTGDPFSKKSI